MLDRFEKLIFSFIIICLIFILTFGISLIKCTNDCNTYKIVTIIFSGGLLLLCIAFAVKYFKRKSINKYKSNSIIDSSNAYTSITT